MKTLQTLYIILYYGIGPPFAFNIATVHFDMDQSLAKFYTILLEEHFQVAWTPLLEAASPS
jgi:hypothetical protein